MDLNQALSHLAAAHKRDDFSPDGGARTVLEKLLAHRRGGSVGAGVGPAVSMGLNELEIAVLLLEATESGLISKEELDPVVRLRFLA